MPHLFENDTPQAEVVHPYGIGSKGEEPIEREIGEAADAAGREMAAFRVEHGERQGFEYLCPVARTLPDVKLVGVARLRYRPQTRRRAHGMRSWKKAEKSGLKSTISSLPKPKVRDRNFPSLDRPEASRGFKGSQRDSKSVSFFKGLKESNITRANRAVEMEQDCRRMMNPKAYFFEAERLERECLNLKLATQICRRTGGKTRSRYLREILPSGCILYRLENVVRTEIQVRRK